MKLTEKDVEFETTRSGGPGGQNVNRRSTAVRLRASIDELPLSEEEKGFVQEHLPPKNRVKGGGIIVENADTRSQHQNRKRALEVANEVIQEAIERGRQAKKRRKRKKRISRGAGGGGGEKDIREEQKKRRRRETTDDLLEEAYSEDPDFMQRYLETEEENGDD